VFNKRGQAEDTVISGDACSHNISGEPNSFVFIYGNAVYWLENVSLHKTEKINTIKNKVLGKKGTSQALNVSRPRLP